MFIQTAAPGQPNRAVTMLDHGLLSGQFAAAFGNASFEAPRPFDEAVYAIAHHDAGWIAFDRDPATDPATGLPYSVFGTPAPLILPTSSASPDYNERHHAYSGLLSSMHTWGIYNGRYGVTSEGRLNRISASDRPAVDAMLAGEKTRQEGLKSALASSPETSAWIEHDKLFQNYKLLQFCDLLAIYFNGKHAEARGEQSFTHVPISASSDTTITIRPKGGDVYGLLPFPLAVEGAEFAFAYRPVFPGQHERDGGWANILRTTPTEWERFKLVAG